MRLAGRELSNKLPHSDSEHRRGLQRFLPTDIVIVSATEVHADFHATYSAVRKKYRYVIADGDVMPPFLNSIRLSLDVSSRDADLMEQGAAPSGHS